MRPNAAALILTLTLTGLTAGPLDEARSLIDEGRPQRARELLERTSPPPSGESEQLLLLARACNALEDYECGLENAKRLVELEPKSSDAHYALTVALRIKLQKVSRMKAMWILGDYKDAFKRAIELDPKNLAAREEQIGFLANAPGIAGGDKDEARARIAELEKLSWHRAMVARSGLEFAEERDADAVKTLKSILEKHPEDDESRLGLAFWYQRKERWADADREFALLEKSERANVAGSALYQRARTRVMGRFEAQKAVEQLRSYLESPNDFAGAPSKAAAWWRLGNAYEQLPDRDAAREAYRKAIALDPEVGEAKKDLKALGG